MEAALHDIKTQNVSAIYCLGDLVGYGPNPNEVIDLLMRNNVKCLMGNHDYACLNKQSMNDMIRGARQSIAYTQLKLSAERFNILQNLPLFISENGIYLTHGMPPALFHEYLDMQSNIELKQAFLSFREKVAFVGHTHLFEVVELTYKGRFENYGFMLSELALKPGSHYLISAGSVGQPRDYNREAGYLIYVTENHQVTKRTFQYDVELTIKKIKAAGLPENNGRRLLKE